VEPGFDQRGGHGRHRYRVQLDVQVAPVSGSPESGTRAPDFSLEISHEAVVEVLRDLDSFVGIAEEDLIRLSMQGGFRTKIIFCLLMEL
jgi:hypothetical protein